MSEHKVELPDGPGMTWVLTGAGLLFVVLRSTVIAKGDPTVAVAIVRETTLLEFFVGVLTTAGRDISWMLIGFGFLYLAWKWDTHRSFWAIATTAGGVVSGLFFVDRVQLVVAALGASGLFAVRRSWARPPMTYILLVVGLVLSVASVAFNDEYWAPAEIVCIRDLPEEPDGTTGRPPTPRPQPPIFVERTFCHGIAESGGPSSKPMLGYVLRDASPLIVLEDSRRELWTFESTRVVARFFCDIKGEAAPDSLLLTRSSGTDRCVHPSGSRSEERP
jgi:hypothetical protein